MSLQEICAFVSRFRFKSNSLASFNTLQKKQIERFQKFTEMKPDGFCCIRLCVLYKEEQAYRTIEYAQSSLKNCHEWKLIPLKNSQGYKYMVCKAYVDTNEGELPTYVYPG